MLLANLLCHWVHFYCCEWPKTKHIIQLSGHTAQDALPTYIQSRGQPYHGAFSRITRRLKSALVVRCCVFEIQKQYRQCTKGNNQICLTIRLECSFISHQLSHCPSISKSFQHQPLPATKLRKHCIVCCYLVVRSHFFVNICLPKCFFSFPCCAQFIHKLESKLNIFLRDMSLKCLNIVYTAIILSLLLLLYYLLLLRAPAVQLLCEESHVPKVEGSNPAPYTGKKFSHIFAVKTVMMFS